MKKAAVIGSPISHSLSPVIFAFLSHRQGRADLSYEAIEVRKGELVPFLERARKELTGFNVTLPHKIDILPFLQDISPEAKAVGAVNGVQIENGKLRGFNTDVFGIEETLSEKNFSIPGSNACIFGAGGAARAIAYVLGRSGAASVMILNRDHSRAEKLVDDFQSLFPKTRFYSLPRSELSAVRNPFSLFVNATSLGMSGGASPGDVFEPLKTLPRTSTALAFDMIYIPTQTAFLSASNALQMRTVGGISMLAHQAIGSYRHFLGASVSADDAELLKCSLAIHLSGKSLFLTGFMGVGKTTVGKRLASLLGYSFVDLDEAIEVKEGISVSEIFRNEGEPHFRALEKDQIRSLLKKKKTVVALGGGSLLDSENQGLIEGAAFLIRLSASLEAIEVRLKNSENRPLIDLLPEDDRKIKVKDLFDLRRSLYEKIPIQVSTDFLSPEAIVKSVLFTVFSNLNIKEVRI